MAARGAGAGEGPEAGAGEEAEEAAEALATAAEGAAPGEAEEGGSIGGLGATAWAEPAMGCLEDGAVSASLRSSSSSRSLVAAS